jgi:hypothetical protein
LCGLEGKREILGYLFRRDSDLLERFRLKIGKMRWLDRLHLVCY